MRRLSLLLAGAGLAVVAGIAVADASGSDDPGLRCADGSLGERRDGGLLCTHTDEKPPPGVSARVLPALEDLRGRRLGRPERLKADPSEAATTQGAAVTEAGPGYRIACVGDGIGGPRVQAIYAVATDKVDRSAAVIPLIRQYAADVDLRINRSAGAQQQGRRVRYVTSPLPDGCQVDVRVVHLSPTGDDSFDTLRAELRSQGLNRSDRKYLVWTDAAVGICGLGEIYQDDRASQDNRNNLGPMYARTDAPCWGYAEAHELLHMLGAVQTSAPNSTSQGHCTDENDALCYEDGSGAVLNSVCPQDPVQYVDCNLDDYFAAAPPAGSYLATHWNVADSAYLQPDAAPPAAPRVTVSAPASMPAGASVPVTAAVTLPAGRTSTVTWSVSRSDCRLSAATGTSTRLACPTTAAGAVEISAAVVDNLGLAASNVADVTLPVPATRRATAMSLTAAPTSVTFGVAVKLTGRLTDPTTGSGVFGMPVTAFQLVGGTTTYRQVGSATTDLSGNVAVTIRPAASGKLIFVSSATGTWATSTSTARAVSVAWGVRATLSTSRLALGGTVRVGVAATPAAGGIPVRLERVTSAGVRTVATGTLASTGKTTLAFKPPARGTYVLRVVVVSRPYRAAGTSARVSLAVV